MSNNENIFINKNDQRTDSNPSQQPWTKRVFNWMYNDTPKENQDEERMNEFIDQDQSNENNVPTIPNICVNSPSSLDCSTEFSSTSDSNDTHLVTITRLNEKGGLGNVIRKLRTGFKKEDDLNRIFWMPDSNSKECYECNLKFSAVRRRHHCRICGQIFCSRCCSRNIDGDKVGYAANRKVRSCNYCFTAVNSVVKPNQQIKTEEQADSNEIENRLSNVDDPNQQQLPKAFHGLFSGDELVASNINEVNKFKSPRRSIDETNSRRLSIIAKQENKLQSTPNFINEPIIEKIDRRRKQLFNSSDENPEPSWVKQIDYRDSSSFDNLISESESNEIVLNLDEEDTNLIDGIEHKVNETDYKQHFLTTDNQFKSQETKDDMYSSNEQIKQDAIDNLIKSSAQSTSLLTFYSDEQMNEDLINSMPLLFNKDDQSEKTECEDESFKYQFDVVYDKFFKKLAQQLLKREKLSFTWFPILKDLVKQVTSSVKPDPDTIEEMDIRKHVKIKTITGGIKQDSKVINGTVFSKHVAHRKMRKEIDKPKILLLNCPIVFNQRTFERYIRLDQVFRQEANYLENLVEKIASFKPNIIILDKIVSIKAQELLCKKKITVVYNVKPNILHKISRLTGGEIVDSIDAQINCPKFGVCDSFYLKTFNNQTLMFFDGCKPDHGCTILLRGSIFKKELKKLKKILQFLIFCDYNWKYEKSFLLSSSAYLTQTTLNEFEQYYEDSSQKLNAQKSKEDNKKNQGLSETNDEINLVQLNNGDNLDPLMNNGNNTSIRSTGTSDPHNLESSFTYSKQMTGEDIINMCNFINDQVLSISPFIYFKIPYLLTAESDKCQIKQYISCKNLFQSIRFQEYVNSNKMRLTVDDAPYKKEESFNELSKNDVHPFLLSDLKFGPNNEETKTLRALFRSSDPIELNNNRKAVKFNKVDEEEDGEQQRDNNDPFNILLHQVFPVLYCNYSLNTSQNPFCIKPFMMEMQFYVVDDFSLGNYLRKYCFTKDVKCKCGNFIIEHISKFSHVYGSIYVRCKELNKSLKRPNSNDIITWSWCQICKSSSQSKVLSTDSLSLSFGKFLQLKIYGNHFRRTNCEQNCLHHSLFHDHFQYFAYKDMVASFKYYPVILREIVLPSTKLNLKIEISTIGQLQIEYPELHKTGIQIMSKIFEQICAYEGESDHDNNDLQFKLLFAEETKNRAEFRDKLDELQNLLKSEPKTVQLRLTIMNKFILLKQLISSFVNNWNNKLGEFEANRKKEDRLSVVKNTKFPRLHSLDVDQLNPNPSSSNRLSAKSSSYTRQNSSEHPVIRELLEASITNENLANSSDNKLDQSLSSQNPVLKDDLNSLKVDNSSLKIDSSRTNSLISSKLSSLDNSREDLSTTDEKKATAEHNVIDRLASLDKSGSSESISSIVFGCTPGIKAALGNEMILNSESDRENYEVVHSTIQMDEIAEEEKLSQNQTVKDGQEGKSQITAKLGSKLANLQAQSNAMNNLLRNPSISNLKKEQPLYRQSVKSLINNFLSGSNTQIVSNPFLHSQHYLLPMREKLPILLDDNDIGSIIAYSLTTLDYERKLHEIQTSLSVQKTRYNSAGNNNQSLASAQNDNYKETDFNLLDASNSSLTTSAICTQISKENPSNDNLDIQFSDSTTNYYCCIHFASQFRRLRSEVLDANLNGNLNQQATNLSTSISSKQSQNSNQDNSFSFDTEEAYIRSISQTVEWVAKGGKSKASFSKTLNDRFVIKVVGKTDIQLFTQHACYYFDYMHRAIVECRPTLFAKIIGAYSVSWKDNVNNASMKKYVLVMENVFFDRRIKQKFDLKGSEKNRLAVTKTSDDVLLDENLTKIIRDNPFYIRNHSKLVLQEAIDNDSKFLCSLNIIDYSLLVGIDEERKELVVAIIDYIQTYTSIKKFETVFKSVGGKIPTVVDPQSYMDRFRNKMNQYFQCLPDEWFSLDVLYDMK